jgi:hypothetical protein
MLDIGSCARKVDLDFSDARHTRKKIGIKLLVQVIFKIQVVSVASQVTEQSVYG